MDTLNRNQWNTKKTYQSSDPWQYNCQTTIDWQDKQISLTRRRYMYSFHGSQNQGHHLRPEKSIIHHHWESLQQTATGVVVCWYYHLKLCDFYEWLVPISSRYLLTIVMTNYIHKKHGCSELFKKFSIDKLPYFQLRPIEFSIATLLLARFRPFNLIFQPYRYKYIYLYLLIKSNRSLTLQRSEDSVVKNKQQNVMRIEMSRTYLRVNRSLNWTRFCGYKNIILTIERRDHSRPLTYL